MELFAVSQSEGKAKARGVGGGMVVKAPSYALRKTPLAPSAQAPGTAHGAHETLTSSRQLGHYLNPK